MVEKLFTITDFSFFVKDLNNYDNFFGNVIVDNDHFTSSYELRRNISYNFQYLEFIDICLYEKLHSTIKMEFIKTYVIIGVSIIESILYYLIKSKGLHKKNHYKVIGILSSNEKDIKNHKTKIESSILVKQKEAIEEPMNLDGMLKKTENKKLLGADQSVYKELNHLRKLRNKIHLYLIEERLDTDWNSFKSNELQLIKKSLLKIVNSEVFRDNDERYQKLFEFLKH